jgi:hypothetical protein
MNGASFLGVLFRSTQVSIAIMFLTGALAVVMAVKPL